MSRNIAFCLSRLAVAAACALLVCCPGLAAAGEASSAAPPAPGKAGEPQGHQMRRYQAFARQAELPAMLVTSETTLQVGEAWQGDTSRCARLTSREKELLAGQFGVPAGVIVKAMQGVSGKPSVGAAEFARHLRVAVVDYRFLQQEWGRYHPPAEGQQVKADAIAALDAGDIAQAWVLYDRLGRPGAPVTAPAPPANLRMVAGR